MKYCITESWLFRYSTIPLFRIPCFIVSRLFEPRTHLEASINNSMLLVLPVPGSYASQTYQLFLHMYILWDKYHHTPILLCRVVLLSNSVS